MNVPAEPAKAGDKDKAPKQSLRERLSDDRVSNFVRVMVLVWSGGLLTLYYLGGLGRLDTTFIGGLLTQTLAGFGVTFTSKKKEEADEAKELKSQPTRKAPPVK